MITRYYDEKRMEHLRDTCLQSFSETLEHQRQIPLARRKKQSEIAKTRAALKASQAILDQKFQEEGSGKTYDIHIRTIVHEKGGKNELYKMKFPV